MYKYLLIAFAVLSAIQLYSQTSGVTQPDFMKYSQIETGAKVNEFDGSFNFSIPVVSIPSGDKIGYTLQLTYQSGTKPNDEATWVGYGWSLNPGAIVRQVKGFPDDFDGVKVEVKSKIKNAIKSTSTNVLNSELYSTDNISLKGLRFESSFSNFNGYSSNYGLSTSLDYESVPFNTVSLQLDNNGQISVSGSIKKKFYDDLFESVGIVKDKNNGFTNELYKNSKLSNFLLNTSNSVLSYYQNVDYGLNLPQFSLNSGNTVSKVFKPTLGLFKGSKKSDLTLGGLGFNESYTDFIEFKTENLYGYMYSGKGIKEQKINSERNKAVLLDYYCEKESGLGVRTENLPIPFSNADLFIVSGEGIGGSFRLYSKKMGIFYPNKVEFTNSVWQGDPSIGLNVGANEPMFSIGVDMAYSYQKDVLQGWNGTGKFGICLDELDENYIAEKDEWWQIDYRIKGNFELDLNYPFNINQEKQYKYFETRKRENTYLNENYFFKFGNDVTYKQTFTSKLPWENYGYERTKELFSPLNVDISFLEGLQIKGNNSLSTILNHGERVPRTSYISCTLFGDYYQVPSSLPQNNVIKYRNDFMFQESNLIASGFSNTIGLNNENISKNESLIKEIKIVNNKGATYYYSLPLMNYDECEYSYNVSENPLGYGYIINGDNFIFNNDDRIKQYSWDGFEAGNQYGTLKRNSGTYASTFLLTQINSEDYVDLTLDGPTPDDLGDYVLFHYRKSSSDYKWREPYIGMKYLKNNLSDSQDDILMYTEGKKEIYYLESIETKTHVAVFITNKFKKNESQVNYEYLNNEFDDELISSNKTRKDAYPAYSGGENINEDYVSDEIRSLKNEPTSSFYNDNPMQYLEKVLLFQKDLSLTALNKKCSTITTPNNVSIEKRNIKISKLLQVSNLSYDQSYPLWQNLPNSSKISNDNPNRYGKLTLKEFWIDKEEVKEPFVSKYKFDYKYNSIENNNNFVIIPQIENDYPKYNSLNMNAWGEYENKFELNSAGTVDCSAYSDNEVSYGINRSNQMIRNYDPSACNLKKIEHPGGLETHIHYEENSYSYVQNRNASLLFKLDQVERRNGFLENKRDNVVKFKYFDTYNNYSDLSEEEKNEFCSMYANWLESRLVNKYVYYKFLYRLADISVVNKKDYRYDFVDGYFTVKSVSANGSIIEIEMNEDIPYQKCTYFVNNNKLGLIKFNKSCEPCSSNIDPQPITNITEVNSNLASYNDNLLKLISPYSSICNEVHPSKSYIKLPIMDYMPKYGDGIRVKRVLNVDKFEVTAETKYNFNAGANKIKVTGNEYYYSEDTTINLNGKSKIFQKSYGVATNEPYNLKSENALKEFHMKIGQVKRSGLKALQANLSNIGYQEISDDFRESEGPFCESILPSANVNYSKVIVTSINNSININSPNGLLGSSNPQKKRNDNNILVKDFFTVKEYPFDMTYNVTSGYYGQNNTKVNLQVIGAHYEPIKGRGDEDATAIMNIAIDEGLSALKLGVNTGISSTMNVPGDDLSVGIGVKYNAESFAQSYQFVINNMHGQIKNIASYSAPDIRNKETWVEGSNIKYEYFQPGEAIPIIESYEDLAISQIQNIKYDWLGLTEEYVNESRELSSISYFPRLDLEANIIKAPPYVVPTLGVNFNFKYNSYRYFVSNKIINLPVFTKSVKTTTNGITKVIDNVAFDPVSGTEVVRRTNSTNSEENKLYLNDAYYNYDIKSHWTNNKDKPLYENADLRYNSFENATKSEHPFDLTLYKKDNPEEYILLVTPLASRSNRSNTSKLIKNLEVNDLIQIKRPNNPNNNNFTLRVKNNFNYGVLLEKIGGSINYQTPILVDIEKIVSNRKNTITNNLGQVNLFGLDLIPNSDYPSSLMHYIDTDKANYPDNLEENKLILEKLNLVESLNQELNDFFNGLKPVLNLTNIDNKYYFEYKDPSTLDNLETETAKSDNLVTNSTLPPLKIKKIYEECSDLSSSNIQIKAYLFKMYFHDEGNPLSIMGNINPNSNIVKLKHNKLTGEVEEDYTIMDLIIEAKNNTENPILVQRFNSLVAVKIANSIDGGPKFIIPKFKLTNNHNITFEMLNFSNTFESNTSNTPVNSQIQKGLEILGIETPYRRFINSLKYAEWNKSWSNELDIFEFCEDSQFDNILLSNRVISMSSNSISNTFTTNEDKFIYLDNICTTTEDKVKKRDIFKNISRNYLPSYIKHSYLFTNEISNSENKLFESYLQPEQNNELISLPINEGDVTKNHLSLNYKYDGVVKGNLKLFDWSNNSKNKNYWVESSEGYITKSGKVNSIKDINGIKSGIVYDNYLGTIPTMEVKNGDPNNSFFESFEYVKQIKESGFPEIVSIDKHTGSYSLNILKSDDYYITPSFAKPITNSSENYIVTMWVKPYGNNSNSSEWNENNKIKGFIKKQSFDEVQSPFEDLKITTNPELFVFNLKEKVQDWYLFEAIVPLLNVNADDYIKIGLQFPNDDNPEHFGVYIDDIRFTTINSDVTSFTTDWKDGMKIKAVFDNNHFPIKFIYNDEGELKKKVLNTTRGVKTLSESNQNMIKEYRIASSGYGLKSNNTSKDMNFNKQEIQSFGNELKSRFDMENNKSKVELINSSYGDTITNSKSELNPQIKYKFDTLLKESTEYQKTKNNFGGKNKVLTKARENIKNNTNAVTGFPNNVEKQENKQELFEIRKNKINYNIIDSVLNKNKKQYHEDTLQKNGVKNNDK
jgi:hypothetical protein